jgi:large subunit ribosomal protein L6
MSRIGKNPVTIPTGVTIELVGNKITVKGSKGELHREIHPKIKVEQVENELIVKRSDESKESRSLHGLTRKLIANMVEGVSKGFEKKLEIVGVGYRAQANKNKINLTLGFSHPIEHVAPTDVEFEIEGDKKNVIIVRGIDKEKVGETAAKVRSYRKPEPYKGKGIRYVDEYVARKAGKSAAAK